MAESGKSYYIWMANLNLALDALESALSIDPEDRIAHYHVMLSLRALGRVDEAKIAEKAYEYHQIDESGTTGNKAVSFGSRA